MTDLEMTKLCALACHPDFDGGDSFVNTVMEPGRVYVLLPKGWTCWQPLHDDAQAMALVKRFKTIAIQCTNDRFDEWAARDYPTGTFVSNRSLNRAIVECVAKMQAQSPDRKNPTGERK